jgi:hypothetical protein
MLVMLTRLVPASVAWSSFMASVTKHGWKLTRAARKERKFLHDDPSRDENGVLTEKSLSKFCEGNPHNAMFFPLAGTTLTRNDGHALYGTEITSITVIIMLTNLGNVIFEISIGDEMPRFGYQYMIARFDTTEKLFAELRRLIDNPVIDEYVPEDEPEDELEDKPEDVTEDKLEDVTEDKLEDEF